MGGIRLYLLSQLVDENSQILDFIAVVRPPDGLQQPAVRNHFPGVLKEVVEQLELLRGQMDDGLSRFTSWLSRSISTESSRTVRECAPAGPPRNGMDAGNQFLDAERFRDVVVGAVLQRLHFLLFRFPRGHDHDWHFGTFANQPAGLESADARHLQIEQNHVRGVVPQALQRLLAAPRVGYLESARDEGGSQHAPRLGFVIDNHDLRGVHRGVTPLTAVPATGSDTWNAAPPAGGLVTQISPP